MVCVCSRKRLDRIRRSSRFHSNSVGRPCLPISGGCSWLGTRSSS